MKRIVKFLGCTAFLLAANSAQAETWSTGDCISQNGEKIFFRLHKGKGEIRYNNGPFSEVFSEVRKPNLGVVVHIGTNGNMTLVINLDNGRGYAVTVFDDRSKVETNVSCRLGTVER